MSCCGEHRARLLAETQHLGDEVLVSNPEIRVAYLGNRPITVRGTFSGRRYAFSAEARILPVNADDSRVMLRTRFFRRA